MMISSAKSSIAEYKTSSTLCDKRCISSMNKTSFSERFVSKAAKSPERSIAGPEVTRKLTPNSLAMILASVVFPRPGGPYNKTWSSASLRFKAALIKIERFSFTLSCPIYSLSFLGRSEYCQLSISISPPDTIRSLISSKIQIPSVIYFISGLFKKSRPKIFIV